MLLILVILCCCCCTSSFCCLRPSTRFSSSPNDKVALLNLCSYHLTISMVRFVCNTRLALLMVDSSTGAAKASRIHSFNRYLSFRRCVCTPILTLVKARAKAESCVGCAAIILCRCLARKAADATGIRSARDTVPLLWSLMLFSLSSFCSSSKSISSSLAVGVGGNCTTTTLDSCSGSSGDEEHCILLASACLLSVAVGYRTQCVVAMVLYRKEREEEEERQLDPNYYNRERKLYFIWFICCHTTFLSQRLRVRCVPHLLQRKALPFPIIIMLMFALIQVYETIGGRA
ncbi:hypothetical protein FB192DRAFT_1365068, partial [Mucor lusitanicus]